MTLHNIVTNYSIPVQCFPKTDDSILLGADYFNQNKTQSLVVFLQENFHIGGHIFDVNTEDKF